MSEFLNNLGADVRGVVRRLRDAVYMPWALSLEMAGFPQLQTVMFDDDGCMSLVRDIFGGAVVAIDHPRPQGRTQRVYLPVLDTSSKPISVDNADGRDVTDTINRCRARAVAMTHGVGLTLWSDFEGDGPSYLEAFKVQPDSDLAAVTEIRDIKEIKNRQGQVTRRQEYLGWHSALAAAMVTDPEFHWEIVETQTVDANGVSSLQPFAKVKGKGWVVGVRVTWKGLEHVEWLPIMGVETVQTNNGAKPMEHQSINTVTAFQWHSACMRCLAKAIALRTGYGIRSYAGELGVRLSDEDKPEPKATERAAGKSQQSSPKSASAPERQQKPAQQATRSDETQQPQGTKAPQEAAGHNELLKEVKGLMPFVIDTTNFFAWLGVRSLEEASTDDLERARAALQARKDRLEPIQPLLPKSEARASVH
jgi:hypothetical protein